ncbi:hypothetical protein DP113_03960 [Brasilonema octagenarum UFV-E1]|uniref:Filamentous haemagglutinin FhaB/tRNA nuclease CdiA-like TPS domain-containing protein n=1 Tax=Brasilonema sennae CENA114 TaxID=415709 RepID=A0A856M8Z7_9CYAN|nr:S-layer family protein [Brasilonema sennae]QDL07182.1 hypothetical protein DP114_04005 [Brasilonema sennae CENA114]QDL13546.1 hypothetical protein DP113_03960 [Brasilonema octagenarum UFV-E1]
MLTINVPIGLGFRNNPQNITSQSAGLEVPQGNSVALVGGNVNLNGGILFAPAGRVELGGLSAAGTVGLNGDGSLSFPVGVQRADVSLTNRVIAYVSAGGGGNIAVNARNLELSGGSLLFAGIQTGLGTPGAQAGDIKIDAKDTVSLDGSGVANFVQEGGLGNAGNIQITTQNLTLKNRAVLSTGTSGTGNGGILTINAKGSISLDNSPIRSSVESTGVGNAGDINITTGSLDLKNGSQIIGGTFGTGNGGIVKINASDTISVDGRNSGGAYSAIGSRVEPSAKKGDAGSVQITTKDLTLGNGNFVSAKTFSLGNAGSVEINAKGSVLVDGGEITSTVEEKGVGNAGGVQLTTTNLTLKNGAVVSTNTLGEGSAGNVFIKASNASLEGNFSLGGNNTRISAVVREDATKAISPGNISIITDKLSLTNGAQVVASTAGQGNAGNIVITAGEISFAGIATDGEDNYPSGVFSTVRDTGRGNGGEIRISADKLSLTDGARLSASTSGQGNAGKVKLEIRNGVTIAGVNDGTSSGIFNNVNTGGVGNAGGVEITTDNFSLTNGARLSTSTSGQGNGGNITINARDTVSLAGDGTSIITDVNQVDAEQIKRNGGNISITTDKLSLTNGAQLSASTGGLGDAGNVIVSAREVSFAGISSDGEDNYPSGIFSRVEDTGIGNGGEIRISADKLSLTDGALLSTSTFGQGNAGKVKLDIRNGITITGVNDGTRSGIFSNVNTGAVGNAGGIDINARSLSLTNGGRISTTNTNTGTGAAGNINITTAKDIRLDNQALITANTNGGEGNITLNSGDLILRRKSSITTNATGTATGGNITINTGNLVALENSKITANAEQGYGGNIFITTTGGRFLSPDSVISATSEAGPQFNGIVQFNTQLTDPTRGLFELSEAVIDPAQQVAQNPCSKGFGSSFTITGRGGLPTDPQKVLSSDNVRVDLIQPVTRTVNSTSTTYKQPSQQPTVKKIVPVQGWIYNEKGQVVLVGYDPTKVGVQREQPAPNSSCAAVK